VNRQSSANVRAIIRAGRFNLCPLIARGFGG